jgi:hypothetical protein
MKEVLILLPFQIQYYKTNDMCAYSQLFNYTVLHSKRWLMTARQENRLQKESVLSNLFYSLVLKKFGVHLFYLLKCLIYFIKSFHFRLKHCITSSESRSTSATVKSNLANVQLSLWLRQGYMCHRSIKDSLVYSRNCIQ